MSDTAQPLHVLLQGDTVASQGVRLGAALAARGYRVTFADAPELAASVRQDYGQECSVNRLLIGGPSFFRQYIVARRLAQLKVDVVHLNYLHPNQTIFARLGAQSPPYIATAWGSDINTKVFEKSQRWLGHLGEVLRGASAVTADSQPILDRCRGLQGKGTSLVPYKRVFFGVDLAIFDRKRVTEASAKWRYQLDISPYTTVVLCARKVLPHYHNDLVLEAFANSQLSNSAVLLLKDHGRNGEKEEIKKLQNRARVLGIEEKIRVAPPIPYEELPALYAVADIAVSYPQADGVASSILELMALGIPVISADLEAYNNVLDDRTTGRRVAHGDVKALTNAMEWFMSEAIHRATIVANARQFVMKHATWESNVDTWVALYKDIVAQRAT